MGGESTSPHRVEPAELCWISELRKIFSTVLYASSVSFGLRVDLVWLHRRSAPLFLRRVYRPQTVEAAELFWVSEAQEISINGLICLIFDLRIDLMWLHRIEGEMTRPQMLEPAVLPQYLKLVGHISSVLSTCSACMSLRFDLVCLHHQRAPLIWRRFDPLTKCGAS